MSLKEVEVLKAKPATKLTSLNSLAIKALQALAKIALDDFKKNVTAQKGKGIEAAIVPELNGKVDGIKVLIK